MAWIVDGSKAWCVDAFAERVNVMNAVAMDQHGNVGAISTAADTFYVFQTLDMPEPEERPRACVPLKEAAD